MTKTEAVFTALLGVGFVALIVGYQLEWTIAVDVFNWFRLVWNLVAGHMFS